MSMTSFYGGRQGASINIVKTYDKIKFSDGESPSYRHAYYAINESQKFIYDNGFIEKTTDNFSEYTWQLVELNGQSVACSDNKSHELPTKEQIDMVSDFKKGGETTGIDGVNYGEYVLIDSDNKEDPDNGKIFRRGLDYTNEMGGAEYKGQIVGPRGGNANLKLDHYNVVDREENKQTTSYTVTDGDLVSGATHDSIDAVWSQVIDEKGQIVDYLIGFKFPYEVIDFTAEMRSPYKSNGDLIDDTVSLIERVDEGNHPFYEKWDIKVPRGTKGDSLSNFKVFFSEIKAGSSYYANESNAKSQTNPVDVVTENTPIVIDTYFNNYENGIAQIEVSGTEYWVNLNDGINAHFGYLETIYDNKRDGVSSWKDVDKYKVIKNIDLQENGQLQIFYTCDEPEDIAEIIRWIWLKSDPSDTRADGIRMNSDGIITVYYNTSIDGINHDNQQVGQMPWVTNITIDLDGTLKIYYNNDVNASSITGGTWDYNTHCYTSDTKLKWIKDIKINTGSGQGGPGEGMGNQQVNVTYNDDSSVDIGNPLNYIVESLVSTEGNVYNVPPNHLLVWYSDPALRASLHTQYYDDDPKINRVWQYKSLKDSRVLDDWFDLGYVKGDAGGLHNLFNIRSKSVLYDENGDAIAPEYLQGWETIDNKDVPIYDREHPIREHAGWCVTLSDPDFPDNDKIIYVFDYNNQVDLDSDSKWYVLGTVSAQLSKVNSFMYVGSGEPEQAGIDFTPNGLWFTTATRECVSN